MTICTNPLPPIKHTPIEAQKPVLKVLGLGGGGSNAVNRMIELGLGGIEYIAANTDHQALENSLAKTRLQLGPRLTRGLGAGGNPDVGKKAAEESHKEIRAALQGADLVFLTAGMGGGTGTGSIAVAARIAQEIGALTIAVVTTPFSFEMGRRQINARDGLKELQKYTDTLITVPNDRLLKVAPKDLPLELAFRLADDVLRQGIQGISELITQPGLINVDFSHICNMMKSGGGALLSIGQGHGVNKANDAIYQALNHPILESIPLENATGIICNFTGGTDLSFLETSQALMELQQKTSDQACIIPGIICNDEMNDRVQVIMVITGLSGTPVAEPVQVKQEQKIEDVAAQTWEAELVGVETQVTRPVVSASMEMYVDSNNLDIPAFLRRRVRSG